MKVYLAAPGQHNWPNLSDDVQERILQLIKQYFDEDKLQCSLKRSRKRKKSSTNPIRKHFAIGLREVMRCLKQNQCSLVLVCSSLAPIILTKPILLLSQMHSIPAFRLKHLSTTLMSIFALPHCSVLALKFSCEENEHLKTFLSHIRQMIDDNDQTKQTTNTVHFVPGKILAPYQNPKRISSGVVQKAKNKKKQNKK